MLINVFCRSQIITLVIDMFLQDTQYNLISTIKSSTVLRPFKSYGYYPYDLNGRRLIILAYTFVKQKSLTVFTLTLVHTTYRHTKLPYYVSFFSDMATDTFICGICNSVFHDITLFVQHKNIGCENTENTIIDKNEDVEDTMTVSVIKVSRNIIMSAPLSNLTRATICCIYILVIEKLMTSKYII